MTKIDNETYEINSTIVLIKDSDEIGWYFYDQFSSQHNESITYKTFELAEKAYSQNKIEWKW